MRNGHDLFDDEITTIIGRGQGNQIVTFIIIDMNRILVRTTGAIAEVPLQEFQLVIWLVKATVSRLLQDEGESTAGHRPQR